MAPPKPIRLKEISYVLSPFQQSIMGGLWKDMGHKVSHYMTGSVKDFALWCVLPVYGIAAYCENFKEKEKQHHRF